MEPTFFATPSEFRAWLDRHHEETSELLVGFFKTSSKRPSITWPEAVDQALCFGWIDGVRRRIDDISYTIRFTPRKPTSTWSAVNIGRVAELSAAGLMRPSGTRAFEGRIEARTAIYAYEQRNNPELEPEHERRFCANARAWAFFSAQPAGYRRTATWWVISAKREETRLRRLANLIEDSDQGRLIAQLRRRG